MNSDVFILIRLQSTRLPKKGMKKISGKPIIKYLIERISSAKKIRNIVVCTTISESDNPLVEYLKKEKILFFRGSEKDILVRLLDASKKFGTDFIVSVDGDDIYTDPLYVDKVVSEFEKTNADYIGNEGFPHGFVPVGIKTKALQKICELKITNNTETGYRNFFTDTKLFTCKNIIFSSIIKFPQNLRLTLDYQEDLNLAKVIFKELGNNFHLENILRLFKEKPDLIKIIEGVDERWKEYWDKNVADLSIRNI